jgi:hypothetical protein
VIERTGDSDREEEAAAAVPFMVMLESLVCVVYDM